MKFDSYVEVSALTILVFMWGLTAFTYSRLPAIIPIHYNSAGEADNYGKRETIILLPVIATIIFIGITQLNKHPYLFNYTVKITAENAPRQYSLATRMLRYLKLSIMIIFTVIVLVTYLYAAGLSNGPGAWFLPFLFGIIFLPMIILSAMWYKKK